MVQLNLRCFVAYMVAFIGLSFSITFACLDDSLVGYWKFNEGSGATAYDETNNNYDGSITSASWVTGVDGNALEFDGNDDYVTFDQTFIFHVEDTASITFWYYRTDNVHRSIFWTRNNDTDENRYHIHNGGPCDYGNTNGFGMDYRNSSGALRPLFLETISLNEWALISILKIGNIYKLYINGKFISTTTDTNNDTPTYTGSWYIGKRTNFMLKGKIDEIRFYKRALSDEEVEQLYYINTIYVDEDATGNDDGTSWTDAYTDLQDALDDATANSYEKIWVAEGTYYPTSGSDRSISFDMKEGVALYGGFDPSTGDDTWDERDYANNATILSGDLDEDGDSTDNSYHVVTSTDSSIIDGFTITKGNSWSQKGGGMYIVSNKDVIVRNCKFERNTAWRTPSFQSRGGAMAVLDTSTVTIENCNFENNVGMYAGAITAENYSDLTIRNCSFLKNSSITAYNYWAGTLYFYGHTTSQFVNCKFIDNYTKYKYAVGYFGGSSTTDFINCTFSGNYSSYYYGTFGNNASTMNLKNCIIWGDSAKTAYDVLLNTNNGVITFYNTDIDNGTSGGHIRNLNGATTTDGGNNIDTDPDFTDESNGDFSLESTSDCIDAGNNSYIPSCTATKDLSGNDRIIDGDDDETETVDMGAYEYQAE